jgi:hypothetical protein
MLIPTLQTLFPEIKGRLLIVVCSYRGGIGNPEPFSFARIMSVLGGLGRILDRLSVLNLRQFIAANRDFFANPRTLAYQSSLVEELLRASTATHVTLVLDRAFEADPARSMFDSMGDVQLRDAAELVRKDDVADAIVVVYPDALGLGWSAFERDLLRLPTHLLNGRRRIQLLDVPTHRRLRWHRLMATTRISELAMIIVVIPVAALLATWDALRGKS